MINFFLENDSLSALTATEDEKKSCIYNKAPGPAPALLATVASLQ